MQFVKSSVYQAEITEGGVREREVDTRSREEVELQERLRKLPEFSRNPNFKSYAEQVLEGLPSTTPEPPPSTEGKQNPNLPHSVTEEEFEFYEALRAQDRRKKLARQREEDAMRDEFHKAREASMKLSVSSVGSAGREQHSAESDGSSLPSVGKLSPFAALGAQKQRYGGASPLGDGSIFELTTRAFQEKRKRRALDARRTFNLVVKKPKDSEAPSKIPSDKAVEAAGAGGRDDTAAKANEDATTASTSKSYGSNKGEDKARVSDKEEQNVFASLCDAYGDNDEDNSDNSG
ncbi:uncharacterized protein LOC34619028 [Cyclospora cayetanensis]|uniref:Uncharacterized protein LOC34619028 n=1 Tax=Cyclospora cayetanensis TaxID=88456 RepID=A0A6P6S1Z9_9EIME|nr:uncharacterized protein LOC34619028 [Cyclospora cayetanensis]